MARTAFNSVTPDDAARLENTRQHFAWQENVSKRRDLSPAARFAAWALALRRNAQSGRCDPSYADIAEHMGGVSERTAMRAVRALERAGLVALVRDHGRRNQFTFLMPEGVTELWQGSEAERGDKPGAKSAAQRGDKPAMSGVTNRCHPNMRKPPTEVSEQRERESAHARDASKSCARPVGAAPVKGQGKKGREGEGPNGAAKRAGRKTSSDFLRLKAAWPRPWVDDDIGQAWLEYDAVTREVAPAAILAGARAWVKAADSPRFLQSLCKWLQGRGWERPPPWVAVRPRPDKAARQGAARPGRKVSLAQSALRAGELAEGWV